MIISILTILGMVGFASAATMKIYPSADSYVEDKHASTNYGLYANLRVGYNVNYGKDRGYVRFDLTPLSGKTITSATFSDYAFAPHSSPKINLFLVTSSWSESTINWNNKPDYSTLIVSKTVGSTGRASFTIPTSYLSGSSFSFAMVEDGENTDVLFSSKEYVDEPYRPYLEVVYDGSGGGCETTADTSGDGKISMSELLEYINQWKEGTVTMSSLLQAINYWKVGDGC